MSIANATKALKRTASCGWPKVLLFGDSITQYSFSHDGCWGALLADKLQRKCDVINRGFSGYNTRWNKLILPRVIAGIPARDVAAVVIMLGANDAVLSEQNPRQHVPLAEYKQNLVDMVTFLMSVRICRHSVILVTPPPCDVPAYTQHCKDQGREAARCETGPGQYAAACRDAAVDSGAVCVDLYSAMLKHEDWRRLLADGLHLSTAGSTFLHDLLWPHVEKLTAHIETNFPTWDEVDLTDPALSLLADQ